MNSTAFGPPYNFNATNAIANVWNVNPAGNLDNTWVNNSNGVRADSYQKKVIILTENSRLRFTIRGGNLKT